MLLERRPPPLSRVETAPSTDSDPGLAPEEPKATSPDDTQEYDAWLVAGGLPVALASVGLVEVLVEALPRPRSVFAAGPATIAALLTREPDAFAVRTKFEQLRAGRFLARAILLELPIAGSMFAERCPWAEPQMAALAKRGGCGRPELYVFVPTTGYQAFTGEEQAEEAAAGMTAALFSPLDEIAAIGAALAAVVERGYSHVLVIASPAIAAAPRFEQLRTRAEKDGCRVSLLLVDPGDPIPPYHYLLPLWGTVERQIERGRTAAQAWIGSRRKSVGATGTVAGS